MNEVKWKIYDSIVSTNRKKSLEIDREVDYFARVKISYGKFGIGWEYKRSFEVFLNLTKE